MSGKLTQRQRRALEYYEMADIPPRDERKLKHPSNSGWSGATIQWALDEGLLKVGVGGWHVLSALGRERLEAARAA